eukprot:437218-Pyramimonas_sp.AAC.1
MAPGSSGAVLDCAEVGILPSGLYAHLGSQGLGRRAHAIVLVGGGKLPIQRLSGAGHMVAGVHLDCPL